MSTREHLVARCPLCERPIWAKQVARLLGFTTKARRFVDLGFVAVTRGKGQGRGWRVRCGLRTLDDVRDVGGHEAVEQLRALARQAFMRMWRFGLLSQDDVQTMTSIHCAQGDLNPGPAPARPLAFFAGYQPGSQIARPPATTHAALNPNPAPARAIPFKR